MGTVHAQSRRTFAQFNWQRHPGQSGGVLCFRWERRVGSKAKSSLRALECAVLLCVCAVCVGVGDATLKRNTRECNEMKHCNVRKAATPLSMVYMLVN